MNCYVRLTLRPDLPVLIHTQAYPSFSLAHVFSQTYILRLIHALSQTHAFSRTHTLNWPVSSNPDFMFSEAK